MGERLRSVIKPFHFPLMLAWLLLFGFFYLASPIWIFLLSFFKDKEGTNDYLKDINIGERKNG